MSAHERALVNKCREVMGVSGVGHACVVLSMSVNDSRSLS